MSLRVRLNLTSLELRDNPSDVPVIDPYGNGNAPPPPPVVPAIVTPPIDNNTTPPTNP